MKQEGLELARYCLGIIPHQPLDSLFVVLKIRLVSIYFINSLRSYYESIIFISIQKLARR